jgi:hypothetical protein
VRLKYLGLAFLFPAIKIIWNFRQLSGKDIQHTADIKTESGSINSFDKRADFTLNTFSRNYQDPQITSG